MAVAVNRKCTKVTKELNVKNKGKIHGFKEAFKQLFILLNFKTKYFILLLTSTFFFEISKYI